MTLKGERIVVLGGSSGIGLATAQAAACEGASVVIASSRKARIDEALATLPTGTEGHVLDLADTYQTQALFARLGPFDHLIFTKHCSSAAWRLQTLMRRVASSRCVIGAPIVPPSMAAAAFARAARSCSPPASRGSGRTRVGRSGQASARPWRV
jgi:threonine dehydrogenase-like Zn-dependent dehydrogenase